MSVAFTSLGKRPPLNQTQIRKLLDENAYLIETIQDYQTKGQVMESLQYQQMLHRNLVYLASIVDTNRNMQTSLPNSQQ